MRILFFIDCLSAGGKERRLIELMKALKLRQNIEFEIAVMSKEIHYHEVFDLDIKIHYLLRSTKKDLSIFYNFYKICKQYKPDIVHCWDSMTALYSIPACKLLHIKLINGMVVDSPAKQNIFNKNWFRAKLTFPFSDIIIGNSNAGLKAYSAPRNKSIVLYNGFNFDRTKDIIKKENIKQQLQTGSNYIIGMVAAFSKYKDYKTYFKAAQLLLNQRNDLIFFATGTDTDSTLSKSLIDEKHIEHFRLLGKRSGIESFINVMDICVLSTFTEGISNSILEYMAFEKPVIATIGGGTNEILKDNITGYLVSPSNPEELAEKLEILLNNADLRLNMGLEGKKRIQNFFSIEKMTNKYVLACENILFES